MVDNCETVVGIKCINLDTVLRPEWLAYSLAMMFISWEHILCQVGFPGGSDGKNSACNAGHPGSFPRLGRSPRKGNGKPLPVFLPGEFHGQGGLWCCDSWGRKESDKTSLSLSLHTYILEKGMSGNPLQSSCLENSMDRGAFEATVHGFGKSQTRLSD